MKSILLAITIIIVANSCNKSNSKIDYYNAHKQKYQIVSVISDAELDLNLDGIKSRDLISENPEIKKSIFAVYWTKKNEGFIELMWPQEHVMPIVNDPVPINYKTDYLVSYAIQANLLSFKYDDPLILPVTGITSYETNTLLGIDPVNISNKNSLRILTTRKFTLAAAGRSQKLLQYLSWKMKIKKSHPFSENDFHES